MTEIHIDLFPKRYEVTRRQFVVTVGTVAKEELTEMYGLDPSNDLIKSYIEEKIKSPEPEKASFILAANQRMRGELGRVLNEAGLGSQNPKTIRERARAEIEEKYRRIDSDPERNFAYLDPLLLTE